MFFHKCYNVLEQPQTPIAKGPELPKKPTKKQLTDDLIRLHKANPNKNITQAFYRKNGKYGDRDQYTHHFGTFAKFKESAGLHNSRLTNKLINQKSKEVDREKFKEYYRTQIHPFNGKYKQSLSKKWVDAMSVSDLHDTKLCPFMWELAMDIAKRRQPDILIFNGDIFGADPFSRWPKDIREHAPVKAGFEFVHKEIFGRARAVLPNAQMHLVIGNHDLWVLKYLADGAPRIRELLSDVLGMRLADLFGLKEYEINLVSKFDLDVWKPEHSEIKQNHITFDKAMTFCHKPTRIFGTSTSTGHTHHPAVTTSWNVHAGTHTLHTTGNMCHCDESYQETPPDAVQGLGYYSWNRHTKSTHTEDISVPGTHVVVDGYRYER